MKTLSTCMALAVTFVVLASAVVMAQGTGQPGSGRQQGPGMRQGAGGRQGGPMQGILKELNLTEAQQQQIQPISMSFRKQMRGLQQAFQEKMKTVLTPEQQTRLEASRAQAQQSGKRGNPQEEMRQLGLTKEQRQQIRVLREEQRPSMQAAFQQYVTQVKAVLTPEQQTRFEKLVKERGPGAGRVQPQGGVRGGGQQRQGPAGGTGPDAK